MFMAPVCCNQVKYQMWQRGIFSPLQSFLLVTVLPLLVLLFSGMLTGPFSEFFNPNPIDLIKRI